MITNPKFFIGIVEDVYDPLEQNRVRVRAIGAHADDIPTGDLPWAYVIMPNTAASTSGIGQTIGLVEGSWVFGTFLDSSETSEQLLILGSIPSQSSDTSQFQYPIRSNKSDTPRSGNQSYHYSQSLNNKVQSRVEDIPLATRPHLSTLKDEEPPKNPSTSLPDPKEYTKPVYPFNNVTQTESGHIIEYDDTAGYERISETHASGTYREIINDGSSITSIKKDKYEIIAGNDTVLIVGNCDLTVEGEVKTLVRGNYTLEVEGNMYTNVHGDHETKVSGASKKEIVGTSDTHINGTTTLTYEENVVNKINGGCVTHVVGTWQQSTDDNYLLDISGNKEENILLNDISMTYGAKTFSSLKGMIVTCAEKIFMNTPVTQVMGDVIAGSGSVSLITHIHGQNNGNDNGGSAETKKSIGGTGRGV